MSEKNPFETYDFPFQTENQPGLAPFTAVPTSTPEDRKRREQMSEGGSIVNELPNHLFIPSSAQSINIMRLANVVVGTTVDLLVFPPPQYKNLRGVKIKFIGYAVFCDALNFSLVNFVPSVDGKRIFPFHGDPQANFKIGLGLGPDFGNENLVPCQLDMEPGQVLKWTFTNADAVDVAAGVRMIGYLDSTMIRKTARFGG